MPNLLLKYWKPLGIALSLALAFGAGRFSRPARVETTKTDQTKTGDKKTDTVFATEDQGLDLRRVKTTVQKKDGTVITREVDTASKKTHEEISEAKTEIHYVDRILTETKIVEAQRSRLKVGDGADLADALRAAQLRWAGRVSFDRPHLDRRLWSELRAARRNAGLRVLKKTSYREVNPNPFTWVSSHRS